MSNSTFFDFLRFFTFSHRPPAGDGKALYPRAHQRAAAAPLAAVCTASTAPGPPRLRRRQGLPLGLGGHGAAATSWWVRRGGRGAAAPSCSLSARVERFAKCCYCFFSQNLAIFRNYRTNLVKFRHFMRFAFSVGKSRFPIEIRSERRNELRKDVETSNASRDVRFEAFERFDVLTLQTLRSV